MPHHKSRWRAALFSLTFLLVACETFGDAAPTPTPPPLQRAAPDASVGETRHAFETAVAPARDLVDLARRYRGLDPEQLAAPGAAAPATVGQLRRFWYKDDDAEEARQIDARLVHQSDAVNMWVDSSRRVDEDEVAAAAAVIADQILPTDRALFGAERAPGLDGDPRVHIMHLADAGQAVAGYFSQGDAYPTSVTPYSNEGEFIYVNLATVDIGSHAYFQVIAHELQHMIHWHQDANEAVWLDEGFGELASLVNGYGPSPFANAYAAQTDVPLTHFEYEGDVGAAHYGASFLFTAYYLDRFGETAVRDLIAVPDDGPDGIDQALAALNGGAFDTLFAEWTVANYLDSRQRGYGPYQYTNLVVPPVAVAAQHDDLPVDAHASVSQYGVDYIEVNHDGPLTFSFTGTRQTPVLAATASSGRYFVSTLPADNSNMTLTRAFDLTGVVSPTLAFSAWYELESGWDYAYVSVSTDDGRGWQPLATVSTTLYNPQGNSYGHGYSGVSGSGEAPVWLRETADLAPFAGGPILVRFEYVTDDAVHEQGFAVDDVALPALDYFEDFESGLGGWTAAGFVRHSGWLPQDFQLQAIFLGPDEARVMPLPLAADNTGEWLLPLDATTDEVVIVVAGLTRYTTQPAAYTYRVVAREARP